MQNKTLRSIRSVSLGLLLSAGICVLAPSPTKAAVPFARGADVGWLQQMEATGCKFYDNNGVQQDCLQILKDLGVESIRFRTFVNPSSDPSNGHCSEPEVVAMAVRAKNMGFRIMIDFHYADNWNGNNVPLAWTNHSWAQLDTDVYNYTWNFMTDLKNNGVTPEWCQTGNEIQGGLMCPAGGTNHMDQMSYLITSGYNAIKAVSPSTKVIVHLADGHDNAFSRWFFDALKSYNTSYDVIGFSYYAQYIGGDYTASIDALSSNLNDMVSRYGKEVMVCEMGGQWWQWDNTYNYISETMGVVNAVSNGKGLGAFYWEPEDTASWNSYQLSAFASSTYQPTPILNAFNGANLIKNPSFDTGNLSKWNTWYSAGNANAVYTEAGGHSGSSSMGMYKSTAYQVSAFQDFTSLPNGTYTLSAWVNSSGGQNHCQLYAKNFGGAEIDYTLPVTATWTQITISGINVSNGQCEIGLWSDANGGNWCHMDDVKFYCQNLVQNPGFETGSTSKWSTWTSSGCSNAIYIPSGGHSGNNSMAMWLATAYGASVSQNFASLPNGNYTLSAWVSSSGGQNYCRMYAKNFGGPEIDYTLPTTSTWTQITISNINVSNGKCEIGLWSDAKAGNYCYMDDVQFYKQ